MVTEVDNAEGYACVGAGNIRHSMYLPPSFAMNLKLLLKIKSFKIDIENMKLRVQTMP